MVSPSRLVCALAATDRKHTLKKTKTKPYGSGVMESVVREQNHWLSCFHLPTALHTTSIRCACVVSLLWQPGPAGLLLSSSLFGCWEKATHWTARVIVMVDRKRLWPLEHNVPRCVLVCCVVVFFYSTLFFVVYLCFVLIISCCLQCFTFLIDTTNFRA